MGYRASVTATAKDMAILAYFVAPGNTPDAQAFPPLFAEMKASGTLALTGRWFGDNAYDTAGDRALLLAEGKVPQFHTKAETGKAPVHPRRARRKSRIRSKVESLFGILVGNYTFGSLRVRGKDPAEIEVALACCAWDFFFLMSHFTGEFEHRISIRELLSGK